jgi:acetylglutamate kinase
VPDRERLHGLRTAITYLRAYKGQTFVVKIGGRLCEPGRTLEGIVEQVSLLQHLGIRVVLVHGGGDQTSQLSERLGLTPQIVAGRRVTDDATLEVAKMTFNGVVNTNLLAACRKNKLRAVGVSGIDGELVRAVRRPVQNVTDPQTRESRQVDYGWVGDITAVDANLLVDLLNAGYTPVVASLAADDNGQVFNVNADTVAARIAVALQAAKYFLVTTVDGVLGNVHDRTTLHSYLESADLRRLIDSGAIGGGMLPKLAACSIALEGGVPRVHVINGLREDALLAEIFTNEGVGTLIVK